MKRTQQDDVFINVLLVMQHKMKLKNIQIRSMRHGSVKSAMDLVPKVGHYCVNMHAHFYKCHTDNNDFFFTFQSNQHGFTYFLLQNLYNVVF